MCSQSAGSGLASIASLTGTNAPNCAATGIAAARSTKTANKDAATKYNLFIILPPTSPEFEIILRIHFQLILNPTSENLRSICAEEHQLRDVHHLRMRSINRTQRSSVTV